MEKRMVQIEDGKHISAMIEGDLKGEVIVFVNGSIFNYRQFMRQLYPRISRELPHDYSYVFYDYIGIGESSELGAEGWVIDQVVEQHTQFLDALGLDRPHHFGYSKGAFVTMLANRAKSIATYGTPNLAYRDETMDKNLKERKRDVEDGIHQLRDRRIDKETYPAVYKELFESIIFGRRELSLGERIKSFLIRRMIRPTLMGTPIRSVIELYRLYAEPYPDLEDYVKRIKEIKDPVLMMHSKQDETVPIEGTYQLNELLQNSRMAVYENLSHTGPALVGRQAAPVVKDYLSFLASLQS